MLKITQVEHLMGLHFKGWLLAKCQALN